MSYLENTFSNNFAIELLQNEIKKLSEANNT
jgi:hypothetical protein